MGNIAGQKRDLEGLARRRFEAVRLHKKGIHLSQIARQLHVARQTVSRWMGQYRREGELSLRKVGRAGRKPLLDAGQLEALKAMLLSGPEAFGFATPLWTCPRVARVIKAEFGVRYHAGHVWKLLDAMEFSCQRPVGRARERDEEAILAWKRKRWPATKKKPAEKGERSSSSTKAE